MRISSVAGGLKQLWPGDFVYMLEDARVSLRKYRLVLLRPAAVHNGVPQGAGVAAGGSLAADRLCLSASFPTGEALDERVHAVLERLKHLFTHVLCSDQVLARGRLVIDFAPRLGPCD